MHCKTPTHLRLGTASGTPPTPFYAPAPGTSRQTPNCMPECLIALNTLTLNLTALPLHIASPPCQHTPVLGVGHVGLQPQLAQPLPQQRVCGQVAAPHAHQALLTHNGQRLTHGVEGADGAGVVVAALRLEPAPVVWQQRQRQQHTKSGSERHLA
eukprot:GHRQ01039568.1.p1 GENE.GHRQ01039568.1~~GHRQ01039568.1.p1  ORF type:complete len:155 (+),score=6.61 GHRQ01039568.1:30-494(+)